MFGVVTKQGRFTEGLLCAIGGSQSFVCIKPFTLDNSERVGSIIVALFDILGNRHSDLSVAGVHSWKVAEWETEPWPFDSRVCVVILFPQCLYKGP